MPASIDREQSVAPTELTLMTVAKAVAAAPTVTERLAGRFDDTSAAGISGVVMRPILSAPAAANHIALSGPRAMPVRSRFAPGTGNSVIAPLIVMRPIWPAPISVNQSAPS